MTAIYIIDHTDPANGSFTISPSKTNGPGSAGQNTNLQLYGAGALRYGEGVNENFLQLLENFASPEATAGSPPIGTGLPDATYFNPAKSIKGQLWFNSTSGKLMMYTGSTWVSTGGTTVSTTEPGTPSEGDLWFDSTTEQLKVYTLTGSPTGWFSVANRYLLKSGDTMTGVLTLYGDPSNPLEAATQQYVDTTGAHATDTDLHLSAAQNTLLDDLPGTLTALELGALDGFDEVGADDTGTVQVQLDKKVSKAGSTMTGILTLSGDPNGSLEAATKQYVDAEVATATSGLGGSVPEIFTTTGAQPGGSPSAKDGDIWFDTANSILYIMGGIWRQIWPAQYS